MPLVRIVKSWTNPDLMRQTPAGSGVWGGCQFTLEPVEQCDYLIVLTHVPHDIRVTVPPDNIWCLMQEPPISLMRWAENGFPLYKRIYTQNPRSQGSPFIQAHGSLPWHIDRSYDQLQAMSKPAKSRNLSWITSNLASHQGHRQRLKFLAALQKAGTPFDLYGRGFEPIADKWDGMASYRYGLAIENHATAHYWTEKVADCFLAWSMPIYYGDSRLEDDFPAESFVRIDIKDRHAPEHVLDIIRSDRAEKQADAIAEARRRVLEQHNLFPRLARLITEDQAANGSRQAVTQALPQVWDLSRYYLESNPLQRAFGSLRRRLWKPSA